MPVFLTRKFQFLPLQAVAVATVTVQRLIRPDNGGLGRSFLSGFFDRAGSLMSESVTILESARPPNASGHRAKRLTIIITVSASASVARERHANANASEGLWTSESSVKTFAITLVQQLV